MNEPLPPPLPGGASPLLTHRLLWYLIHHLTCWSQYCLIEPHRNGPPASCRLDIAIAQYLRGSEQYPLFDEPAVVWWSDADHALLVPCRLSANGGHLSEDAKAFRVVRTGLSAQGFEQTAAL
jgi:hypothetical protein